MSNDREHGWFSEGITEDIRAQPTKIRNFKILSSISLMHFTESSVDPAEIAAILKVNFIIEGSVGRSADQVHLVCQLFDIERGEEIWTETDSVRAITHLRKYTDNAQKTDMEYLPAELELGRLGGPAKCNIINRIILKTCK